MTRRELFENLFRPPEGMTFRIWDKEESISCPFKESCRVCPYLNHKLENHGCDIPWWDEEVDKPHSSYLAYLRDIVMPEVETTGGDNVIQSSEITD